MIDKAVRVIQGGSFLMVFFLVTSANWSHGLMSAIMLGAFMGFLFMMIVAMGVNFVRNVLGV